MRRLVDLAYALVVILATSRTACWLHDQWHHGRPCPRAVRRLRQQLADEEWAKRLMHTAMGR